MVNRYIDSVCVGNKQFVNSTEEEVAAALIAKPLVPVGAINSASDRAAVAFNFGLKFPTMCKANSKFLFKGVMNRNMRCMVLHPMLGSAICTQYASYGSRAVVRSTTRKVQIGDWTYSCEARESSKSVFRSRDSYFSIECQYVPHFRDMHEDVEASNYRPTELLYGRFEHFVGITVERWVGFGQQYYGRCRLYQTTPADAGLHVIDFNAPLQYQAPTPSGGKEWRHIEYVKLCHVNGMVALGPQLQGLLKDEAFIDARVSNARMEEARERKLPLAWANYKTPLKHQEFEQPPLATHQIDRGLWCVMNLNKQ